jgi:hypothetical protein
MNRLSFREKYIVITGIAVILVFAVLQFIYLPLTDRKNDLKRILNIEHDSIQQMMTLRDQYLRLNNGMNRGQQQVADRPPRFTLFSFLDSQAEASGVKKNIDYMRPFSQALDDGPYQLSKVRLKLKNLYLNDFMEFLKRVETSGSGVYIVSISLTQTGENDKLLEAVMEAQMLIAGEPQ